MKNAILTLSLASVCAVPAYTHAAETVSASQPQPSRQELCRQYAAAQLKAVNFQQKGVSNTSIPGPVMSSRYDEKTGFCTVEVENKTANGSFSGKMMTNTFDGVSPTAIHIQTYAMPARIHWESAEPQTLVCEKIYPVRNGKIVCEPYRDNPPALWW